MKKMALLMAISGLCAWSQSLDLSSLDKLGSKAKEANKISLTHDQLQSAMKMLPDDQKKYKSDAVRNLMSGLESVQVRNFEFERPGEYTDADLDGVRAQITKLKGCSSIVDSKEKDEHSQIFMCSQDGKSSGLAIISAEAKEISVVFVKGNLNMSDLNKLGGVMGMPRMQLSPTPRDDSKKDDSK